MGEDKIILKIVEDARKNADELVEQARAESKKEIEEDMKKITKQYEKKKDEIKQEASVLTENEILKAQLEARQIVLAEKRKCLEKAKKEIANLLENMPRDEYKKYTERVLNKAKIEDAEIIIGQKDRQAIEEIAKKKGYKISDEKRDIKAGFIIKKGKVEYNNVFEDMLEFKNENIEKMLSDSLFS